MMEVGVSACILIIELFVRKYTANPLKGGNYNIQTN